MRVLSLAGGGVRGVVTLRVLAELEPAVGARLANRCDLIAGTSTGALIACGLGIGMPPGEILAAYRSMARLVFDGGGGPGIFRPAHSPEPLQRVLAYLFGARTLADLRPRVLVPLYDWRTRRLRVAKSWTPAWAQVPIVSALLGATAAPTYLRPHHHQNAQWIDGGVAANDPAMCALAEAVSLGAELRDVRIVSVGTGAPPIADSPSAAGWGVIRWAPHLVSVLIDGASRAVDYQARALLCERYARLDPPIARDVALDQARSTHDLETDAARWLAGEGGEAVKRAAELIAS